MADRTPKLILDTHQLTEEFFDDTRLLGIMAPVKDYQFCWHLNSTTGLNFRNNNELEIQLTKKKRNYFFTVYEYAEPTRFLSHYVYNNQFDGEYLLPEFKHLDFLWLMKGEYVSTEELKALIYAIKMLPGVQLVNEMTNEKIKHKQHLIF